MRYLTRLTRTDELKAQIAERTKLSDVATDLCDVELFQSGHQKKGLCPIHEEDTPSFNVNDSKGVFHCFGCKAGGDAITLVREVHRMSYREALAKLAEFVGLDIKDYIREATDEERKIDALRDKCEVWIRALKPDTSRTADQVVLKELGVGVGRGGIDDAGFADKPYLFKGTIFPYRSPDGRLLGWKARHPGPEKQMFAVPGDFPLWEPTLFGIQVARQHITNRLIVVEGEWDCVILHSMGIRNVVALGGSKFTDEQLKLLIDLKVPEVVFWMDGDKPGRDAAHAIAKRHWQNTAIRIQVEVCPVGADPEDMVRAIGRVEPKGTNALEWLLRQEYDSQPRESLGQRLDFVTWIREQYGEHLRGMETALVLREAAQWMGVPDADVIDFVRADKSALQSVDSEKVVLGRACREHKYFVATRKRVVGDDFFVLRHQRIWAVLSEMLANGLEWDAVTLRGRCETVGVDPDYVDVLLATGDVNIGYHEEQVVDLSVRRHARDDADRFRDLIADINVPANQAIGALTHGVTSKALGRGSGAFRAISEQVDDAMDLLHERMKNPDDIHGLTLGSQFPRLSRILQGIQKRRLVLVCATSGVGKSTITLQFVTSLSVSLAVPTDFVSLEMDAEEILFKMTAHLTGIDSMKISGGALVGDEIKRVERAMLLLRKSPLRIHAPDGITPSEFLLYARESCMDRRTEAFVFDYAQQVGPDPDMRGKSKYDILGDFGYLVKQKICRGLDVGVILCAQLNREAASMERPSKEQMGDSYDLTRAADVVTILKPNEDSHIYDFIVDKNRQGQSNATLPMEVSLATSTFREVEGGVKIPDYAVV